MNEFDRRKWEPHRGLVLIILALGWVSVSVLALLRDKPVPPVPFLPFSPGPTNPPGVPSTMRARAPLVDEGQAAAPEYGVMAVAPGSDRCFGKPCRVSSLTVTPGVLFASLPACTASLLATIKFTTDDGYVYCDGSTWVALGGTGVNSEPLTASLPLSLYDDGGTVNLTISTTGFATEAYWSGNCDTCIVDTNFIGPVIPSTTSTAGRIQCSWETTGTVGSTNATIQIYDVTAAAEVCSCTIGSCSIAARTPMSCLCGGTLLAGNQNVLRFKTKGDCTVAPQVVACTVHVTSS